MAKRYSREELEALLTIEAEYGPISYQNPMALEVLFFEMTGIHRSSGCLYMANWRIKEGKYNHILYPGELWPLPPAGETGFLSLF